MTDTHKISEILHDLILINNDREKGYIKAAGQLSETESGLKEMFEEFAEESQFFVEELHEKIKLLGTRDGIESTSIAGKIYRIWMGVKYLFTGSDPESILAVCEFGEDAAQKAYKQALEEVADMDYDTQRLIKWQKDTLTESHDFIKNSRDRLRA